MLKLILSISGKPGLYKLVSQAKNMLVVESLQTGKRQPAYAHEKIISLGDIAIFTDNGEVPLGEVMEKIKEKENGGRVSVDLKSDTNILKEYFSGILPDFDRERVYPTDIKKLMSWYNLLVEKGYTDFVKKEEEIKEKEKEEEEPVKEEQAIVKKTTKTIKPKTKKAKEE